MLFYFFEERKSEEDLKKIKKYCNDNISCKRFVGLSLPGNQSGLFNLTLLDSRIHFNDKLDRKLLKNVD